MIPVDWDCWEMGCIGAIFIVHFYQHTPALSPLASGYGYHQRTGIMFSSCQSVPFF